MVQASGVIGLMGWEDIQNVRCIIGEDRGASLLIYRNKTNLRRRINSTGGSSSDKNQKCGQRSGSTVQKMFQGGRM